MWSESSFPEHYSFGTDEPQSSIISAVDAFQRGDPVLIHDANDRENEIDLVYPAHAVTPSDVSRLRNDAGGLICVALSHEVAEQFDLPFLHDVITHDAGEKTTIEYDTRSSFSLTVNHVGTYTGITDNDRALTISALGDAAESPERIDFASEFDTPGHVHLLKAVPELLSERQGHTELGITLAQYANVPPAVVVCEMLDDNTGGAVSRTTAQAYARDHDLTFLESRTIIDEIWRK